MKTIGRQFACILVLLLFFQASLSLADTIIRDSEIENGLQDAVLPMARQAGYPNGIQIRIVLDPSYNAFVVGGRTVFIHTGLLLSARSAEEILGVIAHEIGHLAAGHASLRQEAVKDANLATALTVAAATAAAASGAGGAALGVAIGGVDRAQRRYLATSRKDESVADEWALTLLDSAKISSHGLTDFMRRQASQSMLSTSRQNEYYATHPGARERLATFNDHANQTVEQNRQLSEAELQRLVRIVLKLAAHTQPPRAERLTYRLDWTRSATDPSKVMPDEQSLLYAQAVILFRRGNLDAADALITQIFQRFGGDAWVQEFAGDIDISSGRPEQAAEHYRAALSLRPNSPQISLSLGRALIAMNDNAYLQEAIETLQAANKGEPNWGFAKRQLAIAYGKNQQLAEADLILAEEALDAGHKPRAVQMAKRTLSDKTAPAHIQVRARDILFQLNVPLHDN